MKDMYINKLSLFILYKFELFTVTREIEFSLASVKYFDFS